MRTKTFVCTTIVVVYSLIFMCLGLLICFLSKNLSLHNMISEYIIEHPMATIWIGVGVFSFGFIILLLCFLLFKRCYYRITMGGLETILDEKLVHRYVRHYWQTILPHERINSDVEIVKNKIIIHADFPYVHLEEQEQLLKDVERDLRKIFASTLGYFHEFSLSVNFKGA